MNTASTQLNIGPVLDMVFKSIPIKCSIPETSVQIQDFTGAKLPIQNGKVDIEAGVYRLMVETCGIKSTELVLVDSATQSIRISSSVFGDRVPISSKWGASEAENSLAERITALSCVSTLRHNLNSSVLICIRTEDELCISLRREFTSCSDFLAQEEFDGRKCFLKELASGMWILEIDRICISLCLFDGFQTQVFFDYSNGRISSLTILSSPNREGFRPDREVVLAQLILQMRMESYYFENDSWLNSIYEQSDNPLLVILMQHSISYKMGKVASDYFRANQFNNIRQLPDVSCLISTSEMKKSPQAYPPMLNRSADLLVQASVKECDWDLGKVFVDSLPWRLRKFVWYVWCQQTESGSEKNRRFNWLQNLLLDLIESGIETDPRGSLCNFLNQQVLTVDNVINAILDINARMRSCMDPSRHPQSTSRLLTSNQDRVTSKLFSMFCRIWTDLPLLNSSEVADYVKAGGIAAPEWRRTTWLKLASENEVIQAALFRHKWPMMASKIEYGSGSGFLKSFKKLIEQPVANQEPFREQLTRSELGHLPKSSNRGKTDKISGDSLGTGRRKTSVARVRVRPGNGKITVNDRELELYFKNESGRRMILETLDQIGERESVDVVVRVAGGGVSSQAGAIRMGLARALVGYNEENFQPLRDNGFLTRDSRMKERKKYGRRGARRGVQFSKR
jgi:small subunit ribosomal protein S9